jgi:hypothetical protein
MTFDMITELIYNMTIHITTYDTCVYVDNSVDFVDYLSFFIRDIMYYIYIILIFLIYIFC